MVVTTSGGTSRKTFTVKLPVILSLTPAKGHIGTAVTIAGNNFGPQGTSTVTFFNGVTATPTSWTNTSIKTTVPTGATTGSVVVTTGAGASLVGKKFTVTP